MKIAQLVVNGGSALLDLLGRSAAPLALLVAATTFGILTTRRRTGRRLGQTGLTIVAIQVVAVVAFTVWALIDRAPI